MMGTRSGRGASRTTFTSLALAVLAASCATTQTGGEPRSSVEASRESEANARASATTNATQIAEQQRRSVAAFERSMARETDATLTERAVAVTPELTIRFNASEAPTVTHEADAHVVSLALGTEQRAECTVFNQAVDPANAIRTVVERVRRTMSATAIVGIDAGARGENTSIELRAIYRTTLRGQPVAGQLKLIAVAAGELDMLCMHDEVGYAASFRRVIEPVMRSPSHHAAGDFASYVVSLNGSNIGVMRAYSTRQAAGELEIMAMSMLVPRTQTDLFAVDQASVERVSRDHVIEQITEIENENGTAARKEWTRQGATARYHFVGTHMGRALEGDVTASAPLRSSTAELRALLNNPRASASAPVEIERFSSANPLAIERQQYTLSERVDATHAWINVHIARRDMRFLMGPEDAPLAMEMTLGTLRLRMTRGASL